MGQLVRVKPLWEVSSTLPFVSFLSGSQTKSHNNKALQSHVRKFSLNKTVDHAPDLSSLAERNSLRLETASSWLLHFMTSCLLTLEFVNSNLCEGNGKPVKEHADMCELNLPVCWDTVGHVELVYVWYIKACASQFSWFMFQLHESSVKAVVLLVGRVFTSVVMLLD